MHKGLLDWQVKSSRKAHGSNVIDEMERDTFWGKFKSGFEDPMIRLLCIIAFIMIAMFFFGYSEIYEPVGTIIAILLVTVISAKTEMASDEEYAKLKKSTKEDTCTVYRNSCVVVIPFSGVVVGDYVLLQSGNKIPADGFLIEGALSVDNSSLNGEVEECHKIAFNESSDYVSPEDITGDTFIDDSSLFRGTTIFDGKGVMVVKSVGMSTMMGKMAEDMKSEDVDSPLKVKLTNLSKQISLFGYVGAVVIAAAYMLHFVLLAGGVTEYIASGNIQILKDVLEAVTLAIVIIVCAVPEGLPLMISLVLMKNTSKMLQHNVLVRKPIGIETAGSINILFSDKTGTITKGHLEVVDFFGGSSDKLDMNTCSDLFKSNLLMSICKNTDSMYDNEKNVVGGNATDQAVVRFVNEKDFNMISSDKSLVVTSSQGFSSATKFSSVTIQNEGVFYKGAPERLLEKARTYLDFDGVEQPLDIEKANKHIDSLASSAMRVLAFGYSRTHSVDDSINDDLVILGFAAIRDDVRPEAKEAVRNVQNAGVQVVMITGDRLETATAIACDAGLLGDRYTVLDRYNKGSLVGLDIAAAISKVLEQKPQGIALTSSTLNKMSDSEVKDILGEIRVIARALPTDKSRMVRLAQELNLVVGMTGDGTNDAPALKKADVGFAMGSGTAVAKEAGDIVILDDNFKSIESAILYGRTIYHNILKFCKFQLVINVAAVLVSAVAPFLWVEEPLRVTHLLWVNLVMDALGSLAMGNEPAVEAYMLEQPRRRDENIVSKKMGVQVLTMGIWLTVLSFIYLLTPVFRTFFETDADFMTGYFCLFIISAVVNGFNVRTDSLNVFERIGENKDFSKIMLIIVGVQVLLTFIGGEMFSCSPFGVKGWIVVIALSLSMYPVDLLRKIVTKLVTK